AVVGGITLSFSNIQHFAGATSSQLSGSQNQAIISAISSSANGSSDPANVISGASGTYILGGPSDTALQVSGQKAGYVSDDFTSMIDSQDQNAINISISQSVSTNCS
ncbi:MAG: hypothetical protein P4M14_01630, partial [Gammaproteobacteria bacterium]|nr:hypothetical protein [Gammaproteobacteria bacterium]